MVIIGDGYHWSFMSLMMMRLVIHVIGDNDIGWFVILLVGHVGDILVIEWCLSVIEWL